MNRKGSSEFVVVFGAGTVVVLAVIAWFLMGYPVWRVWSAEQAGRAELAQAEMNRQIQVREAQAAFDAASLLADAEVERARGVAEANQIVADGLGGPEGYLHYLWVQAIQSDAETVIYVPTEAQLPLLEAGRFRVATP